MNYIGIKSNNIEKTVSELNRLLSNYHVYYQNLRNYHWNISGKHFFDLHEKFEDLYNDAKQNIDDIAERILTLRMQPTSTMKEYLEMADIKEKSTMDAQEMVKNILENHASLIKNMRSTIACANEVNDEGTIDMVASFLATIML